MSAYILPAIQYVLAGTPTVLAGCAAFGLHEAVEAYKIHRQSLEHFAGMSQPTQYPYLIHIGGTGDVGRKPDDSFSFTCLEKLTLKPMGFPKEHVCSLSQNSKAENRPNKSFYSLSTEEYLTVVKQRAKEFLKEVTSNTEENIDLIITGLSQGGAIAAQLADSLLKDPDIGHKINRLLLIPIHATLKGSTANFWPKWMRDYLIRFFYPFPVIKEFHRDSDFLKNNRTAIHVLRDMNPRVAIHPVHDGVDPYVLAAHGYAKNNSARWDQILAIALPMLAVSLMFDLPLAGPLLLMAILAGLWNHILGVNTPKIGAHINDFMRDKKIK